jgi:hypothetical protein
MEEMDEYEYERRSWDWSLIENSEQYLFLKDIENNDVDQDDEDQEDESEDADYDIRYSKLLDDLPRLAPHIKWRLSLDGTDSPGAYPSQWGVIYVPDHQSIEAQYIFDRYIGGDNLTNYSYLDRFPAVYQKGRLSPQIENFIEIVRDLADKHDKLRAKDLLRYLQGLLPRLYLAGIDLLDPLSNVHDTSILNHIDNLTESLSTSGIGEVDELLYKIDDELPGTLEDVLGDLLSGLDLYDSETFDEQVAAVYHWWLGFKGTGWGLDLLRCLQLVHTGLYKLEYDRSLR